MGAIGGFLGQMILVIAGAAKVAEKNKIADFFEPRVIQNFLFTFIETKLKTERFTLMVGKAYEQFLLTLEKPLQLNEMRVMKENNYAKLRQVLSDPELYGDEVLALMSQHAALLGLSKEAFDMVYEGFWDLYCKKPHAAAEIQPKKLEGFTAKVKLIVPPSDVQDEEGNLHQAATKLPLKAIIRIRIPMNRPKPEVDDEVPGDEGEGEEKKQESVPASQRGPHEHQQLSTHPDEDQSTFTEQQVEDKVLVVPNVSVSDGLRVWAIHQAAQRALRKDIATVLKKTVKELDEVELDEFITAVEEQATEVEKNIVKIFSLEGTNEFDEIRAKYLNGSTAPIPTFDYEPVQ